MCILFSCYYYLQNVLLLIDSKFIIKECQKMKLKDKCFSISTVPKSDSQEFLCIKSVVNRETRNSLWNNFLYWYFLLSYTFISNFSPVQTFLGRKNKVTENKALHLPHINANFHLKYLSMFSHISDIYFYCLLIFHQTNISHLFTHLVFHSYWGCSQWRAARIKDAWKLLLLVRENQCPWVVRQNSSIGSNVNSLFTVWRFTKKQTNKKPKH